jgi:glycosyltransferase involved in cell wall biosynthesis
MISGRGLDGTSRYCQLITRALVDRGHRVTLFHRPDAWIAANLDSSVGKVETTFKRSVREILRVRSLIRSLATEVIQTHYSSANIFGTLMQGAGAGRVATGHSLNFNPAWFLAERLIAPTEEVARYHHRVNLVPMKRIALVPNFIEVAPLRPEQRAQRAAIRREMGVNDNAVLVGMVGSVVLRKRQGDLVRALMLARERAPALKLALTGSYHDSFAIDALKAVISETGMEAHVSVRVAEPDMGAFLAALDIYAFSSNFEAGPLSILEAMAAGLPVVTTDIGAARLFVASGETGEVVEREGVEALARSLADLALDPGRRQAYGEAGRRRVAAHFSVEAAAARIEEVLAAAAKA